MIGDKKPKFRLDLFDEAVTLWHRSSGDTWSKLGTVHLADKDLNKKLTELRSRATRLTKNVIIRIPRSEVILSKVHLGVFEGEAATNHARKQVRELSPYDMNEISFDLGSKVAKNMAPVGIVTRQTLIEANAFANANGFNATYFTTQYSQQEFAREPRFYLSEGKNISKSLLFLPWIAAVSVGLIVTYFGWSHWSTPYIPEQLIETTVKNPASLIATPKFEKNSAVIEPETQPTVNIGRVLPLNVAPALPSAIGPIKPPAVTDYIALSVSSYSIESKTANPLVTRLANANAELPTVSISSKQLKTNDLVIAEARRDLPDVFSSPDLVFNIESGMAIVPTDVPSTTAPPQPAALATPSLSIDPNQLTRLSETNLSNTPINNASTQSAARPKRPPSPITAEPGTLTPTVEGTPGPKYITIFKGRPTNAPRNRIDSTPLQLTLVNFRPRLRPVTLNIPPRALAAIPLSVEPPIIDITDPTLKALRARVRPTTVVTPGSVVEQTLGATVIVETPKPDFASLAENVADEGVNTTGTELEIAKPITVKISQDPLLEALPNEAPTRVLSNPALRQFRALMRPNGLVSFDKLASLKTENAQIRTGAMSSLLTLADPTLSSLQPRNRPKAMRLISSRVGSSTFSFTNQSLSGIRAMVRPRKLLPIIRSPNSEIEKPDIKQLIERANKEQENPARIIGTKQAITVSPKPKVRTRKLARIFREAVSTSTDQPNAINEAQSSVNASGFTRATAKLPKSAKGTVKSTEPTSVKVASSATQKSNFRKSRMSLVGIFGAPNKRRALVRMPTGRYVKVQTGDKVGGWKVSAISENSLRINKGTRNQTLRIP